MKKSVLIVDDESDTVNLTKKFLQLEKIESFTASDGDQAFDVLKQHHHQIGLILLDIMMPGKSGFTVLDEIKSNPLYNQIKVVLFTVKNLKDFVKKGTELGADGYLTKPFSGKDLINYVKQFLD